MGSLPARPQIWSPGAKERNLRFNVSLSAVGSPLEPQRLYGRFSDRAPLQMHVYSYTQALTHRH